MARFAFLPFSIIASLIAGSIATKLFDRIWAAFSHDEEPPGADDPEATVGRVLFAAALKASVFATTRTLFDRGARRWFERTLGTYPASK